MASYLPQQQDQKQQPDTKDTAQSETNASATPSGPRGDNPGTAGPGNTKVNSSTPENNRGHLNPSAPEDANTTPGTTGKK
jgi:hypothetical protein